MIKYSVRFFYLVFCILFIVLLLSGCGMKVEEKTEEIDGTVPLISESSKPDEQKTQEPVGSYPALITLEPAFRSGFEYGNIINGGLVAEDSGFLFYRSSVDKKLYLSPPGSTDRILISDYPFNQAGNILFSINVVDNWVYFLQEPAQGIFKVKYDGTEKTKLVDEYCEYMYVSDGTIYYVNSDGKQLFKADTDGQNIELLVDEEIGSFCLADGWIYFIEGYYMDSRLVRVKTDGTGRDVIFNERCDKINIDSGRLYVIKSEDNSVWSMKSNGSDARIVEGVIAKNMNVADGWIYFGNLLDSEKLYKAKTDGSGLVKICDLPAASISLTDDWIYFDNHRISRDGGEPEAVE